MTTDSHLTSVLYFEDVVIGQEYISDRRRPVTEEDLKAFCEISGDHSPIHTDEAFARSTVFKRRILHGPFGVAVALGLFTMFDEVSAASIAATDIRDSRFLAPVFLGDELELRMRIDAKRMVSAGGRGIIQRHMRLANQHGTIVQEGTIGLMMWCRPSSTLTD